MRSGIISTYSTELFAKKESSVYFENFRNDMRKEIEQMSDEEISTCDIEDWVGYLADKYFIQPISIFETSVERTLAKTKVKRKNTFRCSSYEKEYFEIDGVRVSFKVFFDGESELFYVIPNSRILSRFYVQSLVGPYKEECGHFTLDFEYTNQELENLGETMAEYVQKQFENEFRSYRTMIENVNSEVNAYNNGLDIIARRLLEERKNKADTFSAISNALQIPLKTNPNSPNVKPVKLKRIARQPFAKPDKVFLPPELCISNEDYENINNIILMCGTAMEKTARSYCLNLEEELRDHLLSTLNTHYENATGETFRKIGKTDIHIEFENKAAFIGECKIWRGESLFQDAVQQVLNYSTWRDLKVSVIVFNKENKSFPAIITKIKKWVTENAISYTQTQPNVWQCKYHRQDMNIDILLTILAFDLYVDSNQFKDCRRKDKQ